MPIATARILAGTAILVALLLAAAAVGGELRTPTCSLPSDLGELFEPGAGECDTNRDGSLTAADLTATILSVTRPPCPGPALLAVYVDDRTASEIVRVRLYGTRSGDDCDAGTLALGYDQTVDCVAGSVLPCLEVGELAPGSWVHTIEVQDPSTGQRQHSAGLAIADSAANRVDFTAFATALKVASRASGGAGSLRSRLQESASAPKPALIWFDEQIFPSAMASVIELDSALPALAASEVTIDGIDAHGRRGNRIVDAHGRSFGALAISGARNHLIGMRLRGAGANNRDVVNISGEGAIANRIDNSIIEGSASADGLSVDQDAGSGFDASVNLLRDSEVSAAADKGVKVTTGAFLRVERSWVHDNANGGLQATLAGNLQVFDSLVERNSGGPAQNGLSVQAAEGEENAAYLESIGNLVRRNGANGLSVRAAVVVVEDSYFAANGASGIRVFNDIGPGSEAVVEGSTAACNAVDGAVVANSSTADFGGGELLSSGDNAFTQNNLPDNGANLRNSSSASITAINAQWEHCGRLTVCDEESVRLRDLNNGGLRTEIHPAQAHRAILAPLIESVKPASGRAGELMWIFGKGFNAIDGHFAEGQCADVAGRNRCVPLRGNCVRIGGVAAAVQAVTPTMLVVRRPFTCLAPAALTVSVDKGSTGLSSNSMTVCTNDGE